MFNLWPTIDDWMKGVLLNYKGTYLKCALLWKHEKDPSLPSLLHRKVPTLQ